MSTWFKFPCDYWTQPRMFKLKRVLKNDALWIPARLWTFAATQDGSGDLSAYKPDELAEAIGYNGSGPKLLHALKDAGYLTESGTVAGWNELFALAEARARSASKAAQARWNKPIQPPPTPPSEEETKQEKKEERERGEAHALRDALRDASPHTLTPGLVLSDTDRAQIASEFDLVEDGVIEAARIFRSIKANFPSDTQTPEALVGWLIASSEGKKLCAKFRKPQVWQPQNLKPDYNGPKSKTGSPWWVWAKENGHRALAEKRWNELAPHERETISRCMGVPYSHNGVDPDVY